VPVRDVPVTLINLPRVLRFAGNSTFYADQTVPRVNDSHQRRGQKSPAGPASSASSRARSTKSPSSKCIASPRDVSRESKGGICQAEGSAEHSRATREITSPCSYRGAVASATRHVRVYSARARARVCTSERRRLYISLRDAAVAVRYYVRHPVYGDGSRATRARNPV